MKIGEFTGSIEKVWQKTKWKSWNESIDPCSGLLIIEDGTTLFFVDEHAAYIYLTSWVFTFGADFVMFRNQTSDLTRKVNF